MLTACRNTGTKIHNKLRYAGTFACVCGQGPTRYLFIGCVILQSFEEGDAFAKTCVEFYKICLYYKKGDKNALNAKLSASISS